MRNEAKYEENKFTTNLDNTQRFLVMLAIEMNEENMNAIHSSGDTYFLIVQTITESARS